MFLVTTADERLWKTDGDILFLGEWCKRLSRRHAWSNLRHETLPYHWDDRERLYHDYRTIGTIYERVLAELSGRLNEVQGVSHSLRFWRILIGPWLRFFIEILFDRYSSIQTAARSGKVTNTLLLPEAAATWTPADLPTFLRWVVSDEYNAYLYSRIIALTDAMRFELSPAASPPEAATLARARKSLPRRIAEMFSRRIAGPLSRVVIVASYLNRRDQIRLELALGQPPYLVPPEIAIASGPVDAGLRRSLLPAAHGDAFERLLATLLPEQIPYAYLEGFRRLSDQSLAAFPHRPRLIVTADAYYANEGFKAWAAHHAERGVRLCIAQHGGHNGSGLWSSVEEHEIKIADPYFTWGWKPAGNDQAATPLSPGTLIRARCNIKRDPRGPILWATMALPRYAYWMYSVPVGPQLLDYFRDQETFAASASPEVTRLLLLRLYPHDFGWEQEARWRAAAPAIRTYVGTQPFSRQLSSSRMFIGTYNSTTFLETFAANYPTVLFWNPRHWEMRASAVPFYDELRAAGILHDTPEAAAAKVNEVYANPWTWWQRPSIQAARAHFCSRFGRVRGDWLVEWKTAFATLRQAAP